MNLALQGGGAHGAFTWGVLDRLLEDDELEISWVSATSAGAVNAVAVASGLSEGGKTSARDKLRGVWEAVHKAGVPDLLRLNPFLYGLSRTPQMAQMASLWSPYEFNPLGFDPLRRLLSESIDFEKLRKDSPIELLIAATEVATGRSRIFRRHELTVEAVLASSCLPTLHHAVEIDGVAYWDGGFSANPDIKTLAMESPVEDTLIVQLNSLVRPGLPTGVREISLHANRLSFNAPLIREIELIETVRECWQGRIGGPRGALRQAGDAPLPSHRGGPLHRRPQPRQHHEAGLAAPELPVQRRARRGRQVAWQPPGEHRPPLHRRSQGALPDARACRRPGRRRRLRTRLR